MLVKTLCDIGYLLCSFVGMNKEKPIGSAEGERTELGMPELATATVDRMRRAFAKFGRTPPPLSFPPKKYEEQIDRSHNHLLRKQLSRIRLWSAPSSKTMAHPTKPNTELSYPPNHRRLNHQSKPSSRNRRCPTTLQQ